MSFWKKKWQCYIIYQPKFFIIFTEIYSDTILYFEMLQYYKSNSGQKSLSYEPLSVISVETSLSYLDSSHLSYILIPLDG